MKTTARIRRISFELTAYLLLQSEHTHWQWQRTLSVDVAVREKTPLVSLQASTKVEPLETR